MLIDVCMAAGGAAVMEVTAKNYIVEEVGCTATRVERLGQRRLAISFSCREAATADYPVGVKPRTSHETWSLVGTKLWVKQK